MNYSPAFFGPNANPVAEFTDATIPKYTNVSLSGNYFFGFGDKTVNPELKIEIPLVSERVSLKLWVALWEYYAVNQAVYDERQMAGNLNGTTNGGDIYVQTRISVLKETKIIPAVILNSTLKTASGEQFAERRYFNTPGYYFDTEIAKSILFKTNIINDLRFVINTGFLCWETTESVQNDSFLYGGKIILSNRAVDFENALAGYTSRIGNGDNPLVYSAKLTVKFHNFHLFAQYKYGIRDWHYNQLQAGVSVDLQRITPRY
ncbi:MAG: hypothetical protein LBN23_06645 [Paludibacter sp.]|nr:hypothetical protein [Paludibacter sp.]